MSVRLTVQLNVKPGTAHDFKVAAKPALARVKRELPPLMTGVAQLSVPLVVDVGSGPNWGRAH